MRRSILFIAILFSSALTAAEPQLSCERGFGKMTWEGVEFHRYKLRANNFPPGKRFHLVVKSFDGTETKTFSYHSNKRGHLILEPLENMEGDVYAICPAKRGERLIFSMQSEDAAYSTDVVPFPLEMKSKKGVKLSLELQGEKGEKFFLMGEGFKPNEQITLSCDVYGHITPIEAFVTPLGEIIAWIHFPADREGGDATLHLKRKQEEVVFPFAWGAPALKIVGACCFEIK
jgi:hypothetical protein